MVRGGSATPRLRLIGVHDLSYGLCRVLMLKHGLKATPHLRSIGVHDLSCGFRTVRMLKHGLQATPRLRSTGVRDSSYRFCKKKILLLLLLPPVETVVAAGTKADQDTITECADHAERNSSALTHLPTTTISIFFRRGPWWLGEC